MPAHRMRVPGLDWVVSATEDEMLEFLGDDDVPCPRCGLPLRQDPLWSRPHLADERGHSYSNIRALVVELYQHGMLAPADRRQDADGRRTAAPWAREFVPRDVPA